MLAKLDASTWIGIWVGVCGVVAGGVLALVLYFRSNRDPKLVYAIWGSVVVDPGAATEIEVRLNGEIVPRVTRTQVEFWNRGRGALSRSAISKSDPWRLRLNEADASMLSSVVRKGDENGAIGTEGVWQDKEVLLLNCEFLNPGDGFVVDVTHTATRFDAVEVGGSVIGGSTIAKWNGDNLLGWFLLTSIPLAGAAFFVLLALLGGHDGAWPDNILPITGAVILIGGILFGMNRVETYAKTGGRPRSSANRSK